MTRRLRDPATTAIGSLVVVGSSGAGKSTLVNGVRATAYGAHVVTPTRFVTRHERREEDGRENSHLDRSRFHLLQRAGRISPCWERTLEHGRRIHYGFESIDANDRRLRVYSANNAFLRNGTPSVLQVLHTAVVVLVTAHADGRLARLAQKEMSAAERDVRLADAGHDLLDHAATTHVIDTTDLTPAEGQSALCAIVDELLDARERVRQAA
jgi:ribose 1,5-bisphosphokinase PhnN